MVFLLKTNKKFKKTHKVNFPFNYPQYYFQYISTFKIYKCLLYLSSSNIYPINSVRSKSTQTPRNCYTTLDHDIEYILYKNCCLLILGWKLLLEDDSTISESI